MLRVAVNGAAGRMGKMVIRAVHEDDGCEVTCAVEREDHPAVGRDSGVEAGVGELGIKIETQLRAEADVAVDFSEPTASLNCALTAASYQLPLVIGTTGHSAQQVETIGHEVAARVPVLLSPNMSVGVNVLFKLVAEAVSALKEGYDVEIVEVHHRHKKDAPSGTAKKLAQIVCETLGWSPQEALIHGRDGGVGERPIRQVAVHAVRGGDIPGDHTVLLAGDGERIELTHRAGNRTIFARGALTAAKALVGKRPGLYAMQDILF